MTYIDIDKPEWANNPDERENIELYKKIVDPSKYFYGCPIRDNALFHDKLTLPRFGHLARKAFMRYAKERYNPHTITMSNEVHIRDLIRCTIEQKVFGQVKDYDWEYLDNFFAFAIGNILDIDIPHNSERIDQHIREDLKTPLFYMDEATKH